MEEKGISEGERRKGREERRRKGYGQAHVNSISNVVNTLVSSSYPTFPCEGKKRYPSLK